MFAPEVYRHRRSRLMQAVGQGVILLPGNELVGMNYRANTYPFRQDGSFLYFCGVDKPGYCLVLDCDNGEALLSGPERSLEDVIWSGPGPSLDEWAAQSGLSVLGGEERLAQFVRVGLADGRAVHFLPQYRGQNILKVSRLLGLDPAVVDAGTSRRLIDAVVALRSVKTAEEIDEIRGAVAISQKMYSLLQEISQPGCPERDIYGRLQGLMLSLGGTEAFPMILTRRGEVLHNHSHDQTLVSGDLLLVDSGVRSERGYASDITRTFPVGGTFTTRQEAVYRVVLEAQAAGCAAMAVGVPFVACHLAAAHAVVKGLNALGLMTGDPEDAVRAGAHALFFPHGLGHMLGLDVHDMESLGEDFVGYDHEFVRSRQFGLSGLRLARRLQAGFVVTVEPGVYFIPALIARWREQNLHRDFINYNEVERFLDFGGIRIEDDVLVTEQRCEVLSRGIPKSLDINGKKGCGGA